MNILVTGSNGMIGKALINNLKNIKNINRENIRINKVFEFNRNNTIEDLEYFCKNSDFIFHLAGVNRVIDDSEYIKENVGFANQLLSILEKYKSKVTIMVASSIQASLVGRYKGSTYGLSKKVVEDLFFSYQERSGNKVAIYRFVNVMGHSKPNYNSVVSTFCWAIANDKNYSVNDPLEELEFIYIDDLIEGMYDLLEGKDLHCDYDGTKKIIQPSGKFSFIQKTYKISLGRIVDLLHKFKASLENFTMPKIPENSFEKKLLSLYLTYLPTNKFKIPLKMNVDERGSFTELLHTEECGQISVNVIKPNNIKGQHWHNSKWEIFVVISGKGMIQKRNISTGEKIEFKVSGSHMEAVYMIPGWTHNIINLSDKEDLVIVMICNENFDKNKPDTFYEIV